MTAQGEELNDISLDRQQAHCVPESLKHVDQQEESVRLHTYNSMVEVTHPAVGILCIAHYPHELWDATPSAYVPVSERRPISIDTAKRTIEAGAWCVRYSDDPLHLTFTDARHRRLLEESKKNPCGYLARGVRAAWTSLLAGQSFYGLGQEPLSQLKLNGLTRILAAHHKGHRGASVPIPFLLSSKSYGIFIDNPHTSRIHVSENGRAIDYQADDGYLRYYLIIGDTPGEVVGRYTLLTGQPSMPPLWLLGNATCRVPCELSGYQSAEQVLKLAEEFRNREIPLDSIILDFQWERWIGSYRWDRHHFGRARSMLSKLRRKGVQVVLILKPAVNRPAPTWSELVRKGLLIRKLNGDTYTGHFHRGRSGFLDVFKPETHEWLGERLHRLHDMGVAGWWTDEGDWIGFSRQCVRDLEYNAEGIRNLYNNAWCSAIYEQSRAQSSHRVVNITRNGYAGIQRFGTSLWSGDVDSTWEGLRDQIQMGLSCGLSGIPFWTTDGGGFCGKPKSEVYIRWAQFATFCPLTRFHGTSPREPWYFGAQAEKIVRAYLRMRYQLLPYVYSFAWRAHIGGEPIIRPMFYHYPDDLRFSDDSREYFFGDQLVVHPIAHSLRELKECPQEVLLPAGRWVEWWDNEMVTGGNYTVQADLARIPLFLRDGGIVPLARSVVSARDSDWSHLTLRLFPGDEEGVFRLYEDDEHTYAFERGAYRETEIRMSPIRKSCRLTLKPIAGKGSIDLPEWHRLTLDIVGDWDVREAQVAGKIYPAVNNEGVLRVQLPPLVAIQEHEIILRE